MDASLRQVNLVIEIHQKQLSLQKKQNQLCMCELEVSFKNSGKKDQETSAVSRPSGDQRQKPSRKTDSAGLCELVELQRQTDDML